HTHASQMRNSGISADSEWAYWKHELLEGNPSTRHYALYGIGRFFPDVALQMLPAWVREARTAQPFRLAAVQALAETQRPEALDVLRGLASELGVQTDLGKNAHLAAAYLEARLNNNTATKVAVAFR